MARDYFFDTSKFGSGEYANDALGGKPIKISLPDNWNDWQSQGQYLTPFAKNYNNGTLMSPQNGEDTWFNASGSGDPYQFFQTGQTPNASMDIGGDRSTAMVWRDPGNSLQYKLAGRPDSYGHADTYLQKPQWWGQFGDMPAWNTLDNTFFEKYPELTNSVIMTEQARAHNFPATAGVWKGALKDPGVMIPLMALGGGALASYLGGGALGADGAAAVDVGLVLVPAREDLLHPRRGDRVLERLLHFAKTCGTKTKLAVGFRYQHLGEEVRLARSPPAMSALISGRTE